MFQQHDVTVTEERSARKQPLTDSEAEALISSVATVQIARGRKLTEVMSAEAGIDQLKGPTGNYRAPMVRRGDTLLVGFDVDALAILVDQ